MTVVQEAVQVREVDFHGDKLQVIGATRDEAAVALRPACEALGLDFSGQVQRLKRAGWATVGVIPTVGADGKDREMFCVSLDTLPMWLATIDVNRVRPEARPKLIVYQRECARVLATHFLTPSQASPVDAALVSSMVQALSMLTGRLEALEQRIAAPVRARTRRSRRPEELGPERLLLLDTLKPPCILVGYGWWIRLPASYVPRIDPVQLLKLNARWDATVKAWKVGPGRRTAQRRQLLSRILGIFGECSVVAKGPGTASASSAANIDVSVEVRELGGGWRHAIHSVARDPFNMSENGLGADRSQSFGKFDLVSVEEI